MLNRTFLITSDIFSTFRFKSALNMTETRSAKTVPTAPILATLTLSAFAVWVFSLVLALLTSVIPDM